MIFGIVSIFVLNVLIHASPVSSTPLDGIEMNVPTVRSSASNRENIDDVLDLKINEYLANGYFSTVHEASLRDTYHGVYSLYVLGMAYQLDVNDVLDYVMSCYDDNSGFFSDCYSTQYLNTYEFVSDSHPFTSLLQANCYAILTLELLGRLDLIDVQQFIDFIWSCYNPVSSGFIGQPHDAGLHSQFKVSTLDNTYYAVKTLDLLMASWTSHVVEKNDIIVHVNGLQYLNPGSSYNGLFANDDDASFDSILPLDDENLLSSYHAIKILDTFGYVGSIDVNALHEYLDLVIDVENDYFNLFFLPSLDGQSNILASAIGLEIAELTGYTGHDKDSMVQYILANRNFLGCWNDGISQPFTQLVHSYQVLRSLDNLNLLGLINSQDKNEIATGILQFYDESSSFALNSKQHVLMATFHSVLRSLEIHDRIGELGLGIDDIYDTILGMLCGYSDYFEYCTNYPSSALGFHLYDIESSHGGVKGKIGSFLSLKNNYHAVSSLKILFKLDDLDNVISLDRFIQVIIDCQYISDLSSSVHGGFFPHSGCQSYPDTIIDNYVLLDQTFHAIEMIKLINEYMGSGTIQTSGINCEALCSYLMEGFMNISGEQYFDMYYQGSIDNIIQDTFFALSILKDLDLYSLDDQKIRNFIIANIEHSSIKNIYYCFKIVELLGLDSPFDMTQTRNLVQDIHDAILMEFYLTTEWKKIDQDIIRWISEMGISNIVTITPNIPASISLGALITISAEIGKLVYSEPSPYMTVKFISDQLGVHSLEIEGNIYTAEIPVPIEAQNYPCVDGMINVYESGAKTGEINVSFQTTYETNEIIEETVLLDGSIDFHCFSQLITGGSTFPSDLHGFKVFIEVYRDQQFIEQNELDPSGAQHADHSEFDLNYKPAIEGSYEFKMYLLDGITGVEREISVFAHVHHEPTSMDRYKDNSPQIAAAIGLSIPLFGVPCVVVAMGSKSKGLGKKFGRE